MSVVVTVADGQQTLSSGLAGSNTVESLKQAFSVLLLSGLSSVVAFLSPFQQPRNSSLGRRCAHSMMRFIDESISLRGETILIILIAVVCSSIFSCLK